MKYIALKLFLLIFICFSCEKDEGNGSILLTVNYNGKAVEQATVYLKKGNDTTSQIPPTVFNKKLGADAIGQVTFDHLLPDNYTLYALGNSSQKMGQVKGKKSIIILNRSRLNHYEATIDTK